MPCAVQVLWDLDVHAAARAASGSAWSSVAKTLTQMPALKRQNTPQAVVDEHLQAINTCDWQRLMAQYPPRGPVLSARRSGGQRPRGGGELFRTFVKPVKDGGLCGLKFKTENTFTVGDTINVQWRATAPFLAEPYRGADAYVTKDGLMWAQVTTFDGAQIKKK